MRDLAADVHVDALRVDAGQRSRKGVERAGVLPAYAEFVLGLAGGDLGVRFRIDIGIDTKSDAGGSATAARDLAQGAKFGLGLDVKAENAGAERKGHFGARFADAREDDLFGRNASRQRAMDLALRDHVGTGAKPRQRANDRDIGVSLDRVANERVAPGERLRKHVIMPFKGRR